MDSATCPPGFLCQRRDHPFPAGTSTDYESFEDLAKKAAEKIPKEIFF